MKLIFKTALNTLLLSTVCLLQAQESDPVNYVNEGLVIDRPEIEADTFYNSGLFVVDQYFDRDLDAAGPIAFEVDVPPYTMLGVTHFTNDFSGNMVGNYRFEKTTSTNSEPATHFLNGGNIRGNDHLLITADLIESSGYLSGGTSGRLEIRGTDVDLTFSGLNAATESSFVFGGGVIRDTNYANPKGIEDLYWGLGTNLVLNATASGGQGQAGRAFDHSFYADPTAFFTPPHEVYDRLTGETNDVFIPLFNLNADFDVSVFTNVINDTNQIIQLAFFRTNFSVAADPNTFIDSAVKWTGPPAGFRTPFSVPIVNYSYNSFNNVSDGPLAQNLFIADTMGARANVGATNLFYLVNYTDTSLQRPNNYEISRDIESLEALAFSTGADPNTTFTNTLLLNPSLVTTVVSNSLYSGYSMEVKAPDPSLDIIVDGVVAPTIFPEPERHPTNMPGRIMIEAENLTMANARIRAANYVGIKSDNYTGAPPASIDSPRYDITLSSDSPTLTVTNIIKRDVARFNGQFSMHSAFWTNQFTTTVTNVDDAGAETISTNFQDAIYHVFVIDPTLRSDQPSEVLNLTLSNPNKVVIGDNLAVDKNVSIDAPEVELYGSVDFAWDLPGVDDSSFEGLNDMTIRSSFNGYGSLVLGKEKDLNSITYIGGSSIFDTIDISADTVSFSQGSLLSAETGGLFINGKDIQLIDGTVITPAGRSVISGDNINIGGLTYDAFAKLDPDAVPDFDLGAILSGRSDKDVSFPSTVAPIEINVGSTLHDDGLGARIIATGGLVINGSNLEGDLSSTSIKSMNPKWRRTLHKWPALDKGAQSEGFNNNLALGSLEFDLTDVPAIVRIEGTTDGDHAIYVRELILSNAAESNFAEAFSIADNMKVYFQTLTTTAGMLLAEDLDQAYGGKFVHVPAEPAPQTSDEIVSVSVSELSDGSISVSLTAEPGVDYVIEKTNNVGSGIWIEVGTISNSRSSSAVISSAPIATDENQAFFRIRAN